MRFQILLDQSGAYRWQLVTEAGSIVAVSAETFVSDAVCEASVLLVQNTSLRTPIEFGELAPAG